jgi:type IV pilus assembly protein PilM
VSLKNQLESILDPISNMFNFGKQSAVGIDIGLSAVKIAEVTGNKVKGKYVLERFSIEPLPEGVVIEDEIQKEEELVDRMGEALKNLGGNPKLCCLGLSGPNTLARKLQVAGGSEEEIEDQVIWESEQYLPFDIDDSTVSYHIVGENEGGGVDLIVAASRNDIRDSFRGICKQAGLAVKIVDLSVIAITNIFEIAMKEKLLEPLKSWLILDIGAQTTSFIIYKNGIIMFTKEINIGGLMITEEIQRQMGVNYWEAEDLKITGDDNGNLPEDILEIMDDVIEAFFAEVKKTIDFYVSSTSDESLVGCVVTGGSCQIPGVLEGLEALLGLDVSVLNPFDVIEYNPKKFSEEEISEIAYRGVAALGLGMRYVK